MYRCQLNVAMFAVTSALGMSWQHLNDPNLLVRSVYGFQMSDVSEATPTLWPRQKLKRDKIVSLYRYLDVRGDPGLADLERFMIKKNPKAGNIELLFLDANKHWLSLHNKRTG